MHKALLKWHHNHQLHNNHRHHHRQRRHNQPWKWHHQRLLCLHYFQNGNAPQRKHRVTLERNLVVLPSHARLNARRYKSILIMVQKYLCKHLYWVLEKGFSIWSNMFLYASERMILQREILRHDANFSISFSVMMKFKILKYSTRFCGQMINISSSIITQKLIEKSVLYLVPLLVRKVQNSFLNVLHFAQRTSF